MVARVIVVRGDYRFFNSIEEALASGVLRPGDVVLVVEGNIAVLRVEEPRETRDSDRQRASVAVAAVREGGATSAAPRTAPAAEPRVALVFDQMFRGFADILARELPSNFEMHEVVGRGLERPVRIGRISKWPARDDFDVLKIVEQLAGKTDVVVFFTGDKKLANQAAALALGNVRVEYMPPNEYPGKESIAKAMIKAALEAAGQPAQAEG